MRIVFRMINLEKFIHELKWLRCKNKIKSKNINNFFFLMNFSLYFFFLSSQSINRNEFLLHLNQNKLYRGRKQNSNQPSGLPIIIAFAGNILEIIILCFITVINFFCLIESLWLNFHAKFSIKLTIFCFENGGFE